MHRHVRKPVALLLERQLDVQSHRVGLPLRRPLVRRLHDPWSAARDHRQPMLAKRPSQRLRLPIVRILRRRPRRPENRHRRPQPRQRLERIHEFRHDPKYPPGILLHKAIPMLVHARNIRQAEPSRQAPPHPPVMEPLTIVRTDPSAIIGLRGATNVLVITNGTP